MASERLFSLPAGSLSDQLVALIEHTVQDIDGCLVHPPPLELLVSIQAMLDQCEHLLGEWHLEPGYWQPAQEPADAAA